jgi:hypothetical protein
MAVQEKHVAAVAKRLRLETARFLTDGDAVNQPRRDGDRLRAAVRFTAPGAFARGRAVLR